MRLYQYADKMGERSLKAVLRTFNLFEFLPIYKSTYLKVNTAPAIQALNALRVNIQSVKKVNGGCFRSAWLIG